MTTLLEEIREKCPSEMLERKNTQEITDHINVNRKAVNDYWLTDRGLVSDLIALSGGTDLSDSILTKLDALAASSRSTKAIMKRLENDPIGVNFGDNALIAQFQMLGSIGVFTSEEVTALSGLALQDDKVDEFQVRLVCWSDSGEWLV